MGLACEMMTSQSYILRNAFVLAIGFDETTLFFGGNTTIFACEGGPRCNPSFGHDQRLFDHLNKAGADNVAISGLVTGFIALQNNRALFSPFASSDTLESRFNVGG